MNAPTKRRHGPPNTDLGIHGLLINILTGVPRLDDAGCVGRAELFEAQRDDEPRTEVLERHALAEDLCAQCPALEACRDWAADQPADGSVLAGHSTARFSGRPQGHVA